jgi:hypothetical protein
MCVWDSGATGHRIHKYIFVDISLYFGICTYVYVCIYIYIYTYVHRCASSRVCPWPLHKVRIRSRMFSQNRRKAVRHARARHASRRHFLHEASQASVPINEDSCVHRTVGGVLHALSGENSSAHNDTVRHASVNEKPARILHTDLKNKNR